VKAALITAVLLALWGAIENYQVETGPGVADPYKAADQVDRLASAIQMLPRSAIVGYVSNAAGETPAALAMFNTARYALAPRLLAQGTDREWVLGNFSEQVDYAAVGREHGLQLVRDFGGGVVLYRGIPK
jgi:hypothetical protein